MTTNPLTQALPTGSTTSTGSTSASAGTALGKDDFLKLLVGQLQHQDPLAPSDDQQWIGQMAQFSQLEQVTNIAASDEKIVTSLARSSTLSLIGHTVSYTDADGNAASGVVQQVDMSKEGSATLTIDGQAGVDVAAVTQVR